jgi:hypothetical protein
MTEELLGLLHEILRGWSGAPPRLVYVSDAGDREQSFYTKRLCRMRHPVTRERLKWQRIVDYYHAAQRLTTMAEALRLEPDRAVQWARRMRRLLKGPRGVARVLHSAGALKARYGTKNAEQRRAFQTACAYLRRLRKAMRYHEFKQAGWPIGSGVTEAACKTLFTQRVKLSGMRWKKPGLQVVLNLRMLVLSGVWETVYRQTLAPMTAAPIILTTAGQSSTPRRVSQKHRQKAA